MKHGKGEKAMSEEEVLEALEVIREALMRTARCFFSCYADCEDAVQECFYKAWRGRESIQNPEYFKTWATRILVNECKTMLRKKVPIPMEADDSSVYYESEYENIIEFDPLRKAMERICFAEETSFWKRKHSRRTKDCEKQGFGGQRHQQADAQKGTDVPCLQVCDGTEKSEKNQTCLRRKALSLWVKWE